MRSHPSRVRGLKYPWRRRSLFLRWSHPSRVRGLKSRHESVWRAPEGVAPFTGAWIEITNVTDYDSLTIVAPCTGAWIEIEKMKKALGVDTGSHPSRVRGLKFWLDEPRGSERRRRTLHGCVD